MTVSVPRRERWGLVGLQSDDIVAADTQAREGVRLIRSSKNMVWSNGIDGIYQGRVWL